MLPGLQRATVKIISCFIPALDDQESESDGDSIFEDPQSSRIENESYGHTVDAMNSNTCNAGYIPLVDGYFYETEEDSTVFSYGQQSHQRLVAMAG